MTKRRVQLCAIVALSLLILSVITFARFKTSAQEPAKQIDVVSDPALNEIANYREWTRVSEQPQLVIDASLIGG